MILTLWHWLWSTCWENIRPRQSTLDLLLPVWRAAELVESWKVNVNVIVVEAPHGWVRGPPVVETGYIPLSSIQVVYEDCTNPHQGRTLPCHHTTALCISNTHLTMAHHGSPWFTMGHYGHLSSPQFTLNKQQLADCWATESCELGTLLPVHGSNSIRNAFPTVQPVKDAHWLSEANQTSFCFSVTESSLRNVKWTVTNWSITETNQWCAGVWPEDGRSWVTSRRNLIWDETRIGPNKLQDVSQNYLDNVLSHNLIRAETR